VVCALASPESKSDTAAKAAQKLFILVLQHYGDWVTGVQAGQGRFP
jgi:hypothetical protein